MKLKVYIFVLVLACLGLGARATDGHYLDLYDSANQAYKAGDYDSAKAIYSEIAQNGMVSSELFYNMGNTHFKNGNIPASILYYERALRLNPNDEDTRYNLEIARGFITDKIDPVDQVFFVDWWNDLARSFSPTFWGVLFLILLMFSATLLTFFFIAKQRKVKQLGLLGGIALLVAAVFIVMLASTSQDFIDKPEAIVFAASVNVKSEPGLNATDQFVIHEGLKVEVLDEDGDWTRIKLADGNSGWLPSQSIEQI